MERNDRKIINESTLTLIILIVAILGTVIPLHIQTMCAINAIQTEMKDFHGRLCAIEERSRK